MPSVVGELTRANEGRRSAFGLSTAGLSLFVALESPL